MTAKRWIARPLGLVASAALLTACTAIEAGSDDAPSAAAPAAPPEIASDPAPSSQDLQRAEFPMTDPADLDTYLWLEEVEGDDALAWVRAQNERSLADLQADPRYAGFEAAALDIATSDARIPYGSVRGGKVYNFWQDETNVRGLWRRTPIESYRTDSPDWETVLDFDALAEAEDANWVFKGANCFQPLGGGQQHCIVSLSNGGKDAIVNREFDLETKAFVEGGFATPEAKQGAAWLDTDTLLISTDWGNDGSTLTESGYPTTVKRWTRGTPLEAAETLYTGDVTDVGVWPFIVELEDGRRLAMATEADTFFTATYWYFPDNAEAVKVPLPPKATIQGVWDGQILVILQQDWETFKSGDLIAFTAETFLDTGTLGDVTLVFRPSETQAVNGVAIGKKAALLSINDNVAARLLNLSHADGTWITSDVNLPGAGQVGIAFANAREATMFLNYEGFLTPDSLLEFDPEAGTIARLKSLPAKFDAEGLAVEQRFATSADGTRIPYFLVTREGTNTDGPVPTLLYGYGGFEVSLQPGYSGIIGKLWLEQGGAYAVANTRGGGEFGPAWHQAGLKLNRQRIYDDFIAVGEDLIASGLTDANHLGIYGGSNGGLLMGVMLNQRPELWNASIVAVPLLDMLRYHTLLAGASWVDEYGSPEVPEERAFLETISPVHNFDASKPYPTPFFITSTKDDRVHPGHARKMAKQFEDAGLPFFYYENIDGGHSAAANQTELAKRSALQYTYLAQRLMGTPAPDAAGQSGAE
ncbi:MAG: prolyl oligopeptidase family serine peptidase [Pseudomonadota bacterium]